MKNKSYIDYYIKLFKGAKECNNYFSEKGEKSEFSKDFNTFINSLYEYVKNNIENNAIVDVPYVKIIDMIYSFEESPEDLSSLIILVTNKIKKEFNDKKEEISKDKKNIEKIVVLLDKLIEYTELTWLQKIKIIDLIFKDISIIKEKQTILEEPSDKIKTILEEIIKNDNKTRERLNNSLSKLESSQERLESSKKRLDESQNNLDKRNNELEECVFKFNKTMNYFETKTKDMQQFGETKWKDIEKWMEERQQQLTSYNDKFKDYDEKFEEYDNTLKKSTMDIVAVIGIFSTIIFAIFGGLSQLAALGGKLPETPIYKIFIYSGITATILLLVVFLSFYSLSRLTNLNLKSCDCTDKNCKHNKVQKYPVILLSLWTFFSFISVGFIILFLKTYINGHWLNNNYILSTIFTLLIIVPIFSFIILIIYIKKKIITNV